MWSSSWEWLTTTVPPWDSKRGLTHLQARQNLKNLLVEEGEGWAAGSGMPFGVLRAIFFVQEDNRQIPADPKSAC